MDPNGGVEGLVNLTRLASAAAAGAPMHAPSGYTLVAENGFIAAVRDCDGERVARVALPQGGFLDEIASLTLKFYCHPLPDAVD